MHPRRSPPRRTRCARRSAPRGRTCSSALPTRSSPWWSTSCSTSSLGRRRRRRPTRRRRRRPTRRRAAPLPPGAPAGSGALVTHPAAGGRRRASSTTSRASTTAGATTAARRGGQDDGRGGVRGTDFGDCECNPLVANGRRLQVAEGVLLQHAAALSRAQPACRSARAVSRPRRAASAPENTDGAKHRCRVTVEPSPPSPPPSPPPPSPPPAFPSPSPPKHASAASSCGRPTPRLARVGAADAVGGDGGIETGARIVAPGTVARYLYVRTFLDREAPFRVD